MYIVGDIPEPSVADEIEFESWPEEQQRLAQRVLHGPRYGTHPGYGGSTVDRPVLNPRS